MSSLFDYQINAISQMKEIVEKTGFGGVLAFDPGMGKTRTMIEFLKERRRRKEVLPSYLPFLIVCPLSVLSHWEEEIKHVFTVSEKEKDFFLPRILIYHNMSKSALPSDSHYDFIITTYDILKRNDDYLFSKQYDTIVLDEAHVIKNGASKKPPKVFKSVVEISKQSKIRWCITGTPFNNSVNDLLSLSIFIGTSNFTPTDKSSWKHNVNDWVAKHVIFKKKEGIPPPNYHDILIKPFDQEVKVVESVLKQAKELYEEWKYDDNFTSRMQKQGNILSLISTMRQFSDTHHIANPDFNPQEVYDTSSKTQEIISIMNTIIERRESIIVFSQFTRYLNILKSVITLKFPTAKILVFDGSVSHENRDKIISKFNKRNARLLKKAKAKGEAKASSFTPLVLLIGLFSGGVGINLQSCKNLILSEPWYNPFIEQQAEDRIYRIGQTEQVNIYRLTIDNSIEQWVQQIKENKLNKAVQVGVLKSFKVGNVSTFKMKDLLFLFKERKEERKEKEKDLSSSFSSFLSSFPSFLFPLDYENEDVKEVFLEEKERRSSPSPSFAFSCSLSFFSTFISFFTKKDISHFHKKINDFTENEINDILVQVRISSSFSSFILFHRVHSIELDADKLKQCLHYFEPFRFD